MHKPKSKHLLEKLVLMRRFGHDRRGVAAVEFALVAIPFFFIVFAIIETCLVTTAGVILTNSVNGAARQVMTGAVQKGEMDEAGFRKVICDGIGAMMSCDRLKLDMRTYPAGESIPAMQMRDGGVDEIGVLLRPGSGGHDHGPARLLRVAVDAAFLNRLAEETNGNMILSSVVAFMNEPFGSSVNPNATC